MQNNITNNIIEKINQIKKIAKVSLFILIVIGSVLFYYLLDEIAMPISIAILVVVSLFVFSPYFYLQNRYESWYLKEVYPLIFENLNNNNEIFSFKKSLLSIEIINNLKIFQNIDLIENEFMICLDSKNENMKNINISKINCYNYINHKINNKDIKEGRKLPVFDGVAISSEFINKINIPDMVFISNSIPKSNSSYSQLRFKNEFYEDTNIVKILDTDFQVYSNVQEDYLKIIEDNINISEILNVTNNFILSINKNNIFIFIPGVNYLNIPHNKDEVNHVLINTFEILELLKKMFISKI